MTHARQQIRSRLEVTTLVSMAASTGAGVIYRTRTRPVTLYPSIAIIGDNEITLEVENPGYINAAVTDKRYRRFYDVKIEIAVKGNDDPDDVLDALCVTAENLIALDDSMGGGVIATDLLSVLFERDGTGEEAIHIATMTYRIEYRTTAADPETFLM